MKALVLLVAALHLVALLVGCGGDDDQTIQTSLAFQFQVRGQDVDGDGTLVDQAPIDLSVDAPWRRFSDTIESDFGQSPEALTLDGVSMRLSDSSQGVQDLGDVFNGPLAFRFQTSGNQNEYSLALVDIRAASEATLIENFLVEFDYQQIDQVDREKIIAGQMQTLFVGQASDNFRDTGAVADLFVRLDFSASAPADPIAP